MAKRKTQSTGTRYRILVIKTGDGYRDFRSDRYREDEFQTEKIITDYGHDKKEDKGEVIKDLLEIFIAQEKELEATKDIIQDFQQAHKNLIQK